MQPTPILSTIRTHGLLRHPRHISNAAEGRMRKGLCAAWVVLCIGCSAQHERAGWQYAGGPGRANSYGSAVTTTLNTATSYDLLPDSVDLLSTPVMLASNVTVAALADGRLVRIENGVIRWSYRSSDAAPFASRIAVDADGSVYAVDSRARLVCLHADGSRRWAYALGDTLVPTLSGDVLRTRLHAVVATAAGIIAAIDAASGREAWRVHVGALRHQQLASDASGNVYAIVAGSPDTLIAIDDRGSRRIAAALPDMQVTAGPVIGGAGVVVAGRTRGTADGAFGAVSAVDRTGRLRWTNRIGTIPQSISVSGDTSYVVTAEPGAVGLRASRIIAIDGGGTRRWGIWYDKVITSPLIIASDAMLFTVTEDASATWHDVLILWRDGRIRRHIAGTNVPRIIPDPVVTPTQTVMMAAADGCRIVTLDETLMYNILPQ
ncbi:MAG: PQQ-like beta-propeller repeat protein [Candidatus Kapabacteria bacterium]|nr:PQQ-like beta-propeller repeat protein [Candidatus Kapabacteria bacterium]